MSNLSEKQQSLLDFVKKYQWRGRHRETNQYAVDNLGYDPEGVNRFNWLKYSTPWARSTYTENTGEKHFPNNFYSAQINRVPAQYVGGNEGEYRYYGGAYSHPMSNQARTAANQKANTAPFTHVGDSIPTSEAMYLRNLWENE